MQGLAPACFFCVPDLVPVQGEGRRGDDRHDALVPRRGSGLGGRAGLARIHLHEQTAVFCPSAECRRGLHATLDEATGDIWLLDLPTCTRLVRSLPFR